MARLYRVLAELEMYVLADSETDARNDVSLYIAEEASNMDVDAEPMWSINDMRDDWLDVIPYGGDGVKTCRQILEEKESDNG